MPASGRVVSFRGAISHEGGYQASPIAVFTISRPRRELVSRRVWAKVILKGVAPPVMDPAGTGTPVGRHAEMADGSYLARRGR